ncbi:hypothetical protein [Flagellimonas pelagia]|nr:hypothetical protein [Allomuricauda maritima]TXJ94673.1 hypothetical protein FQ017_09560 [Allomuricauda maritima]
MEIYWICFDQEQFDHLSNIYSKGNCLLLSMGVIKKEAEPLADFKLNELVMGDRFLRHQQDWAFDYLKSIQPLAYNFVKEKGLKFVFGEITHAHEILLYRMLKMFKELKCKYLHPQSVRIPNKRFLFLEDEFQSKVCGEHLILNKEWESEWKIVEAVRPRRVAQVDKEVKNELSFSGRLKRLSNFFTNSNIKSDLPSVVHNKTKRSLIAVVQELNKFMYRFVKTDSFEVIQDKKYVLYTLHMQPEASVDVVGAYYDNQLKNIINIWRILPDDWFIVIKEHSNAIGNRSPKFFKSFKTLRNSILLHERVDSHKIIENAQAIFTVSGTIAYEAALKGKMAFTFADIFFNKLKNCTKISIETFRAIENFDDLIQMAKRANEGKMSIEDYSAYIYKISFKGIVDAPLNSEDWADEANFETVSRSFVSFINAIDE